MSEIFTRLDPRGRVDEIVSEGASVHLERIDNHLFSLTLIHGDQRVLVEIGTPSTYRRNVYAVVKANGTIDPTEGVSYATRKIAPR